MVVAMMMAEARFSSPSISLAMMKLVTAVGEPRSTTDMTREECGTWAAWRKNQMRAGRTRSLRSVASMTRPSLSRMGEAPREAPTVIRARGRVGVARSVNVLLKVSVSSYPSAEKAIPKAHPKTIGFRASCVPIRFQFDGFLRE